MSPSPAKFKPGHEIPVESGNSDCGYTNFKMGSQYFLNLNPFQNTLFISICSHSGPLKDRELIIREFRRRRAAQRLPDLTGQIDKGSIAEKIPGHTLLPQVKVTLRSTTTKGVFKVLTDSDGIYTFENIPRDTYQISADLPPHLEITHTSLDSIAATNPPLTILGNTGNSAACHVWLSAQSTSSIAGRLTSLRRRWQDGEIAIYGISSTRKNREPLLYADPDE